MKFLPGLHRCGTRLISLSIVTGAFCVASAIHAETIFTVNGVEVDSAVVDAYFATRLGGQNAQVTPEQREVLVRELKDLYVLTTQDDVGELADDPAIAGQIELQTRSILAGAVANRFLGNVNVTEEELLASYNDQIERSPKEELKASHILVESQGEAVEIIKELDGGADFAELAKQKSTGPTGPNGGDLGWFSPSGMVAPFADAVLAMKNGEYSKQPVQTQFGWHVILRTDSRASVPPTFEASRQQLEALVRNQKFQAHLEQLRSTAKE